MYSPSLSVAILQTFLQRRLAANEVLSLESPRTLVRLLRDLFRLTLIVHPELADHQIPMVGRVDFDVLRQLAESFGRFWSVDDRGRAAIVWGRVPVGVLLGNLEASIERPAELELLDLGTTLRAHQIVPSALQQDCSRLAASPP